jgi:hypothetical protein
VFVMKIVTFLIFCLLPLPSPVEADRSLPTDLISSASLDRPHTRSAAIHRPWGFPIAGEPSDPGLVASLSDEEEESPDDPFFDAALPHVFAWESLRGVDVSNSRWSRPAVLTALPCPIPLRC